MQEIKRMLNGVSTDARTLMWNRCSHSLPYFTMFLFSYSYIHMILSRDTL